MNTFEKSENNAAKILAQDAAHHANSYADSGDLSAATVALLLQALELAGGASFIKPQEELNGNR